MYYIKIITLYLSTFIVVPIYNWRFEFAILFTCLPIIFTLLFLLVVFVNLYVYTRIIICIYISLISNSPSLIQIWEYTAVLSNDLTITIMNVIYTYYKYAENFKMFLRMISNWSLTVYTENFFSILYILHVLVIYF